ncbi:MAG: recombinase family protein, partial [Clostridia bacterium]
MKKAVIYARFSTEMQREGLSIESQVFRCTEFITRNGWTVSKVYSDEAKSGQYSTRTAFNQIIADATLGQFDIVVIDAITRASRFEDFFQYYSWKNQLENCNVKLESATENITDDSIGDLVEFMALWKSKQEIKTIRSNVKRAMDLNASQAKFNGGNIPIGFDIDENNMYVKNENEAKIVNLIFDLYLDGKGYKQIADTLNSNGYRKKNGGLFVPLPIRDILLNEKYVGTYTYNKNLSRNKFGARKGEKPIAEQVIMPGALPVIVEKEKFNKVKNIMESKIMAKNTATAK